MWRHGARILLLLTLACAISTGLPGQTTITVTNLNDAGTGSLRDAIAAASTTVQDTIDFQTGLTGTITLATPLAINKPLKINGPAGSPGVTISGNASVSCVLIGTAAPTQPSAVEVSNLRLLDGQAGSTGGMAVLHASYSVSLTSVTFETCTSGFRGGGLYALAGNSLTMTGCTFNGNTSASDGAGAYIGFSATLANCSFTGGSAAGLGGGFYAKGNLNLSSCSINNNSGYRGAGVYVESGSLTMTGTSVSGNQIAGAPGSGAGIFKFGSGSLDLSNCTFDANVAVGSGGAIWIENGNSVITGCTFTSNECGGTGGAIYKEGSGTLQISNSAFGQNLVISTTYSEGGSAISITAGPGDISDCTFTTNSGVGGGTVKISRSATTVSVATSTFDGNSAGAGAGVSAERSTTAPPVVTVTDCKFSGNTANLGGAIYTSINDLTLSGCEFNNNTATSFGGALLAHQTAVALTVTSCKFVGNSTSGAGIGGGAMHTECPSLLIQNTQFEGNTAERGGAINLAGPNSATWELVGCTFSNNTSTSLGGGGIAVYYLSTSNTGDCLMTNCTFSGNAANGTGNGGGLYVRAGNNTTINAELTNCTFAENTSATPANGISIAVEASATNGTCAVTFRNTIVSGSGTTNVAVVGTGTVSLVSDDNNLCSDSSGNFTATHDLTNTNPNLGPLLDNGGPTKTHMPLPGSPAIDQGRAIGGVTTDQRGIGRPVDDGAVSNAGNGNGSDIGAVEAPLPTRDIDVLGALSGVSLGHAAASSVNDDLGACSAAVPTTFTWTIRNFGALDLNVSNITATPSGASPNCSVTTPTALMPSSPVGSQSSATFDIDVTPTSAGAFEFTISIASDDPDEDPYVIVVSGTGATYPPTLSLAAGSSFVDNGTFDLALNPGATLSAAELEADDPSPDPLDITITFSTGPMGATPPSGITAPSSQTGVPTSSLPYLLQWTGTAAAANTPGVYVWTVQVDDGFTLVSRNVEITINDVALTHNASTGVTGDGLTSGTAYALAYQVGSSATQDVANCNDGNTSQTLGVSGQAQTGAPGGATASFSFSLAGTNPATLQVQPSASLSSTDIGTFTYSVGITDGTSTVTVFVSIDVSGSAPAVTSGAPPSSATVGTAYSYTIAASGAPTPTLSASGVPGWLTFNAGNGMLQGTPTSGDVGTSGPITLTAANGISPDATLTFTITVSAGSGGGTGGGGGGSDGGCSTSEPDSAAQLLIACALLLLLAYRRRRRKNLSARGGFYGDL